MEISLKKKNDKDIEKKKKIILIQSNNFKKY